MIDGGEGQVNAAKQILDILDLDISVVGLAKKEELLFLPNQTQPIVLQHSNNALRILQAVRDETHRVATTKSRNQQIKELEFSSFKRIPGIGTERSLKLITRYGGLAEIAKQSPQAVSQECGIPIDTAKQVIKTAKATLKS